MEAGKVDGDLLPSSSHQPVHMVTGLTSALGDAALPFVQGESVTPGCLRGNEDEKPSRESNSWEEEVFFLYITFRMAFDQC